MSKKSSALTLTLILIIGIGIGWLAGLSVSPVIAGILTTVMGIVAAVVTALIGIKSDQSDSNTLSKFSGNVEAWPLAALILGLVFGSIGGIYARTHNWLGVDYISYELQQWDSPYIDKAEVAYRLMESRYPYQGPAWIRSTTTNTVSQTLSAEVDMWVAAGMEKQDVVQRLFEIKYPDEITITANANNTQSGDDSPNLGNLKNDADIVSGDQNVCSALKPVAIRNKYGQLTGKLKDRVEENSELKILITGIIQVLDKHISDPDIQLQLLNDIVVDKILKCEFD